MWQFSLEDKCAKSGRSYSIYVLHGGMKSFIKYKIIIMIIIIKFLTILIKIITIIITKILIIMVMVMVIVLNWGLKNNNKKEIGACE